MKTKILLFIAIASMLVISASAQKNAAVEKALTDKEHMAWKNLVDKKYDDFASMFADDYEGVYASAVTTKASEVAAVKEIPFTAATVTDVKVKMLDAGNALVTYNVKADITMPDGKTASENMRATTVWVKRGKNWLVVYHSNISIQQ
ncbi:MAG TPA: nuclear transport factor 2 family protein [Pyrinomonadaceae bacterium]|jgi:hypothetical protein